MAWGTGEPYAAEMIETARLSPSNAKGRNACGAAATVSRSLVLANVHLHRSMWMNINMKLHN